MNEFIETGIGNYSLKEDVNFFVSKLNKDISTLQSIVSNPKETLELCIACNYDYDDYLKDIQNKQEMLNEYKESIFDLMLEYS